MCRVAFALLTASILAGCAAAPRGNGAAASTVWLAQLRADPEEFPMAGRREVRVVYALSNSSRQTQRLDFPTAQKLEVTMRDPEGRNLFRWSEDRSFAQAASSVLVNPGERLEYEADVPTRDMVSGRTYAVEAALIGYPETAASVVLRPR